MAERVTTLQTRTMTPDDVLDVFTGYYRHKREYGLFSDRDVVVDFALLVLEYNMACGEAFWTGKHTGKSLNKLFGTEISRKEWDKLLAPSEATLGEVCELIASRARIPVIQPLSLLGQPCLAAGAFNTLRSMLDQAGADISDVAPSTPLAPYLRGHPSFCLALLTLAPNTLPPFRCRAYWLQRLCHIAPFWSYILIFGTGLVCTIDVQWLPLFIAALGFFAMSYVANRLESKTPLREIKLEGVETFRDLSYVVAGEVERP